MSTIRKNRLAHCLTKYRGLYTLLSPTILGLSSLLTLWDECPVSDGSRKTLLSEIFNLQVKTGASIFATSRLIPEIMKDFEGRTTSIEIRASDDDVRRYLDGKMSQLRPFVLRNFALQEEIKTEIIKAIDGMYVPS